MNSKVSLFSLLRYFIDRFSLLNYIHDKQQSNDFHWFKSVYHDLVSKYGNGYVIIKRKKILGFYSQLEDAYEATTKRHKLGTFIIQEIRTDKIAYQTTFRYRPRFK